MAGVAVLRVRKFFAVLTIAALGIALTSCAAPRDQFIDTVLEENGLTGFTLATENFDGSCGGVAFCQQPLYTITYVATSAIAAEQVCSEVMAAAVNFGATGYGPYGMSEVYELAGSEAQAQELCLAGKGIIFYDKGTDDGIAKNTVVWEFGNSSVPENYYTIEFAFSRDSERVGTTWEFSELTG